MGKFNKNLIKGMSEQNERVRLGAGLLNDLSKKEVKMKVEHVPISMIKENERNKFSINNIEELAWSIQRMGLLNPLHVKKTEDGYVLLGGERRLTAIKTLVANEEVTDWNEETRIPVVVQNFDDIDLPLNDDMKELFAIITTNKESRKYTDSDKLIELRAWKELIVELRSAGVEAIDAKGEDGEDKSIQIKGVKTRDILTNATDMSRGTINSFELVENQGAEEVKEALLNQEISLSVAKEIVKETGSKEEQKEVLNKLKEEGEPITSNMIEEKVSESRLENIEEQTGTKISQSKFKKEIKDIVASLKNEVVYLSDEEIGRYNNCIEELRKLLMQ